MVLEQVSGVWLFLGDSSRRFGKLASNFLLVVEEKIRQRAVANALSKKTKGGGKGLKELMSLVSFINYDSASGKARGSNKEMALIVSQ